MYFLKNTCGVLMDKESEEDNKISKNYFIFIRHANGSQDIVNVFPEYTVSQLKTIVCTKMNLNPSLMVFILDGKQIENNQSLEELGVHKKTIIYAVNNIK
jgi:hypothetical protein